MSSHQNGKLGKITHSKSAFWDGDTVDGSEIPGEKTSWGEGSWNPIIYNAYIYVYIYIYPSWLGMGFMNHQQYVRFVPRVKIWRSDRLPGVEQLAEVLPQILCRHEKVRVGQTTWEKS